MIDMRNALFLLFCLLSFPILGRAEPIVESGCLTVRSEGSDSFLLSIPDSVKSGKLSVQKMFLSNPSRAVVDLVGMKCSVARTVNLPNSDSVSTVRVGSHADRIRVVFELKPTTKRDLSFSLSGNDVTVKLGELADETDNTEVAAVTAPRKAPIEVVQRTKDPTYEVVDNVIKEKPVDVEHSAADSSATRPGADVPQFAPSSIPQLHTTDGVERAKVDSSDGVPVKIESGPTAGVPAKAPSAVVDEVKEQPAPISPDAGKTAVNAIYFQLTKSGNAPAAVIDLSAVVPYILTKKRDDLYELDIDNAQLAGRHLLLPQFPPDNFTGFSAIIAQEIAGKVTIQIFIDEGMLLLPFTAEGKLWLRVGKR